jgi:hypothetical protein
VLTATRCVRVTWCPNLDKAVYKEKRFEFEDVIFEKEKDLFET